jgi:hypothetical protein
LPRRNIIAVDRIAAASSAKKECARGQEQQRGGEVDCPVRKKREGHCLGALIERDYFACALQFG